jgi:hypothetical protein
MVECYICDKTLEKSNLTVEHIILNAIGGKLKSNNLICQICADEINGIDGALTTGLKALGNLLNPDRDKRKNPPFRAKMTGTQEWVYLRPGEKPVQAQNEPLVENRLNDNENPHIHIRATPSQFKQVLENLKDDIDITQANIDQIVRNIVPQERFIEADVTVTFDDKCFRSVCKTAINYYIYNQGDPSFIKHLIPYIKNQSDGHYVWYYYPDNPIHNQDIAHTLFINGNSKEEILYAYLELYNVFKLIVLLSDCYTGENIQESYCFDLISSKTIPIKSELNFNLSKSDILNLVRNRHWGY